MENGQWKKEIPGNGWYTEERLQEQTKKKDRREVRKPGNMMRCTFLNGSTWSTERKHMRRFKGTFDVFVEIEHMMRKEESGVAVQQRGKARMEVRSRRSNDY